MNSKYGGGSSKGGKSKVSKSANPKGGKLRRDLQEDVIPADANNRELDLTVAVKEQRDRSGGRIRRRTLP